VNFFEKENQKIRKLLKLIDRKEVFGFPFQLALIHLSSFDEAPLRLFEGENRHY